ncbi:aminopeptidase P family N-terminal domain-containing protein, partial [Chloroflexota bacterium]
MSIPNRLEKLRQKLAKEEIGAVLISQPENRRYLSGFDGSAGRLLITPEHTILATDFRYLEQARRQAPQYEIFHTAGDPARWFPELISRLGLSRLGFEAGHIPFATYQEFSAIARKEQLNLIPTTGLVESLRV